MKKIWLILIAILLLFIIGCSLGVTPKVLPKKPVCGDNKLEPPEVCDKASNQGCSYGSFCNEGCTDCNQGVFCCTDKSELGAGGSLYYVAKKDPSQCIGLIEDEECFSLTQGNITNAVSFFNSQTQAALSCAFGYSCINNTLVKLCGEDYHEAVREKATVYSNKLDALEKAPCKPREKTNQTEELSPEEKTEVGTEREKETTLNLMHDLNIKPLCAEGGNSIHVTAELAGDVDKIDQVQFAYMIGEGKTFKVEILEKSSPKINTYSADIPYAKGNYQYALQIKTINNTVQTLTKDTLTVEACAQPETKSFCSTSSEYDGWCYFFNLVPVDPDSYNTGNCVTPNFDNPKEMCEDLAKNKTIPELLNYCKEKTDSSERDKCYGAVAAVIQDLKTCDLASNKDLCYYGYAIKSGFITKSNDHKECDRISDPEIKTQCKEWTFLS
ncbi:hypothetical protein HZA97_06380 [Candidatus Woesearchaeota archaeon]|nr:hypothetical protein [Candidatus Woesearchaeota archaeon]